MCRPQYVRQAMATAFASLSLLVLVYGWANAGEISRLDVQTVFKEPVVMANQVSEPPVIDGGFTDEAWKAGDWIELGWSNADVAGYPKAWSKMQAACDKENLYFLLLLREHGSVRTKTKTDNSSGIVKDDHISIALQAGGTKFAGDPLVFIKVNPAGAKFVQLVSGATGKPLEKLEGFEAKVRGHSNRRWCYEVKIPFTALFNKASDVPAIWKANFVRRRFYHQWNDVKPDMHGYSVWWTSWVEDANIPYFQPHAKQSKPLQQMGVLYVPVGKNAPANVRDLKPGVGEALAKKKADAADKARKTPPPGFRVSQHDLEEHLKAPVTFVRNVDKGPSIKGDLSDPLWKSAPPLEFRYMELAVSQPVRKNPTKVHILTDEKNLYLGFDCTEQFPDDMQTEGAIWRTECLDIFIDPGRTEDNKYYQFGISVNGKINAMRIKNVKHWKPESLVVKTGRSAKGWTAELKIGLADLGIQKGQKPKWWGANFFRTRWARRTKADDSPGWDNWDTAWRPNPLGYPQAPEWWGHLYLQKADVVKPRMAAFLESKGVKVKDLGLKVLAKAPEKPVQHFEEAGFTYKGKQPAFAKKPKVAKRGDEVTIEFAAKDYTDVTVSIVDAKGKIVRHLAAGVLGKNPPAPLKADSLEQRLVWDGKDDDGKPLNAAQCKVRVGLGLSAKFERIIGWRPPVPRTNGLLVDKKGHVYVAGGGVEVDHGHGPGSCIRVYDRDGTYLRTAHPYPSSLKPEQLKGIRAIPTPDGQYWPVLYQTLNKSWLPHTPAIPPQQPVMTGKQEIILANTVMRGMYHGRMLLKLGSDGGAPADCVGPDISFYQTDGNLIMSMSPDDKYVYVTGLAGKYMWDKGHNHHCIYRVTWDAPKLREEFRKPFIGKFQCPGTGPGELNKPTGLTVDKDGRIIVADSGNNRLAVFKPDGSPLKQIALKGATRVAMDRKTGAIYVIAKLGNRWDLVKVKSLDDPSETARLPIILGRSFPCLAVDSEASPVIVWLGNGDKILDKGSKLERAGNLRKLNKGPFDPVSVRFEGNIMSIDRETEELICGKWHVFDGKTGKFLRKIPMGRAAVGWGGEVAVGRDGKYYMRGGTGANFLVRFDRNGKQLKFGNGKTQIEKLYGGHGNSNRGHCVAPNGDIYYFHHYRPHGNTMSCISQVAPSGEIKRFRFINNKFTSGSGVKVDRAGNVYVGLALKPRGEYIPKIFEGRLPTNGRGPHPWFYYRQFYGSVVKFSPEGGEVVSDPKGKYTATNYNHFHGCNIKGAKWVHYGFSHCHQKDIQSSRCSCESSRFDLDDHARLFIPDLLTSSIDVIDSNANRIMRFGAWGNMDARGPDSPCPKPDIPIAWGILVCVSDSACYIGDLVNCRVVKVALSHAAEEEVEIR